MDSIPLADEVEGIEVLGRNRPIRNVEAQKVRIRLSFDEEKSQEPERLTQRRR